MKIALSATRRADAIGRIDAIVAKMASMKTPPSDADARVVTCGILVFPGCSASAAIVPVDVLRIANRVLAARSARPALCFEARWVGARGEAQVRLDGLSLEIARPSPCEALLIAGVEHRDARDLAMTIDVLRPERQWLAERHVDHELLLAGCSAVSLVAAAGLLGGRSVTTSWWLARALREAHPELQIAQADMLVEDGRWITAAGLSSYFELALAVVRRWGGADLAQTVAKLLMRDALPGSQAPYVTGALLAHDRPAVIERACRWLDRHLARTWTVAELAAHCHVSQRTLLRHFAAHFGHGPIRHAQQLRIDRCKSLLEGSRRSFEAITAACGYSDVASFAKAFKRGVGLTPLQYRQRFGLRG